MLRLRMQDRVTSGIKVIALIAFGGYVAWNAAWLLRGHLPPSIFAYCTGFPCPTTGVARSLVSLCAGDVRGFFLFNPLTSVYLALIGVSAVILIKRGIQGAHWVLPNFVAWSWLVALALGWLLKFAIGNKYW